MSWQKLTLHAPLSLVEKLSDYLDEAGAVAVTLEATDTEELFEPPPDSTPLWQHTTIHALFTEDFPLLITLLADVQTFAASAVLSCQIEQVPNQDWQKNFMHTVTPVCFANKLWVCPSWHVVPDDKPCVLLDPGLAFGTGSHPTTQLCLEWLAQHIKGGECVVDYGCGSGILALAALKLGAKKVWAVDNDPQAIEATLENARRNQMSDQALAVVLPTALPAIQADVLVANILANPLITLAPHFASLVVLDGRIVLSGILTEQVESLVNAYASWFDFSAPVLGGESWVRLVGKKIG